MKLQFSRSFKRGFTLIEMLVVVGIFTIMTGILLANLPEFRDRSQLELLAQQVAINIRTAQVYGIGTKATIATEQSSQTNRFDVWYGIHFNKPVVTPSEPAGLRTFTLFADKNQDGIFDREAEKELPYEISGRRYGIVKICAKGGSGDNERENCDLGDQVGSGTGEVTVVYRRPYTEASICIGSSACGSADGGETWANYDRLSIILKAAGGNEAKEISVWSNGQISVEQGLYELDKND